MQTQKFLKSLMAALPELALILGDQWPLIQKKLHKILDSTDWDDPRQAQNGIDTILDMLQDTPAAEMIQEMVDAHAAEESEEAPADAFPIERERGIDDSGDDPESSTGSKRGFTGERGIDDFTGGRERGGLDDTSEDPESSTGSKRGVAGERSLNDLVKKESKAISSMENPQAQAEKLQEMSGARTSESSAPEEAIPADCAVYAPPKASPGDQLLVQVFVYPPEEEEKVEKRAKQADETAEQRAVQTLAIDLVPGTRLDISLEIPGLEIDEPNAFTTWRGRTNAVQFFAEVPDNMSPKKLVGTVHVAAAGVPVGTLRFRLEIVSSVQVAADLKPQPAETTANRFRKVFLSYSSKDRPEVLRRAQALRLVGIDFFQDVLNLEPGQRWEKELYRNIDDCDAVFLFWSSHSAASEWVVREIKYAIERKKGNHDNPPAIVPIPVEVPVPRPPKILQHLHFNDALLAHIHLADSQ